MRLQGDMTSQGEMLPKVNMWKEKKRRDTKSPHMRSLLKAKRFGGGRCKRHWKATI